VRNVKRVVEAVQHRYPYVHRLAIGDLSDRNGGHLAPHRSHQSGRDVDIGFYFKRRPAGYPESFVVGTARNLDLAANFYMFERFCDAGSVQEIFLVTELQKLFYDWGKRHGASRATLDHMFQYPSPPGSAHGCIHHEHGHDDHIHVRFKR
ncbi:MAG TPA: penicillin-insensitive murein endopeptidase, partial [Kofleriaceae bacterium]|jgi:hypothetical protein|nr:penicillin-insensitive murein endopeptidase [Kofleriaceae bacterium]